MRIVGGKYRGKKLLSPDGKDVRPTSERAREAIFNILYSYTGGDYSLWNIADIYGGTGAFGFEAISRGFNSVTFVDINPTILQKNTKCFPMEANKIHIIKADATKLPGVKTSFDVIFTDAPYACGLTEKTLNQLLIKEWIGSKTLCIIEISKDETVEIPQVLEVFDERVYGPARILFLRQK